MNTVSVWGCTLPQVLAACMSEATCHLGSLQTVVRNANAQVWDCYSTGLQARVTPCGAAASVSGFHEGPSEAAGPAGAARSPQLYWP